MAPPPPWLRPCESVIITQWPRLIMLRYHLRNDKTKNDLPNNFLTSHLKIKTCMYDVFSQPWLSWTRKKKNTGKTLRNIMILLRNAYVLFTSNVMVMAFEFPQLSDFFHHPRWNRKVQSIRSKCYSVWSRVTKTVFSWKGLHYSDMGHSSKRGIFKILAHSFNFYSIMKLRELSLF